MLVMSRKHGESIELSELGVVVKVIGLTRSKVQLGIDAPPQITINRSEIADDRKKSAGDAGAATGDDPRNDHLAQQHLAQQHLAQQHLAQQTAEHLAQVEQELAALAELAQSTDRPLAQQIAAESIQRLAGIRRTLRLAARRNGDAQPIAEFVRVRSDVLQYLRADGEEEEETKSEQRLEFKTPEDSPTSCLRQSRSGYAIVSTVPSQSYVA